MKSESYPVFPKPATPAKVDRSAFLYLDPKAPKTEFAQCGTCVMFDPKRERCSIHGSNVRVVAESSCGFYIHGKPSLQKIGAPEVTPEESGLVTRPVRCENCRFFKKDHSICDLFHDLNQDHPDKFKLKEKVDPKGCCNAQTEK